MTAPAATKGDLAPATAGAGRRSGRHADGPCFAEGRRSRRWGAGGIVEALLDAVGPEGAILAYCSWDRSPYEETLNGARLSSADEAAWPAFDPSRAGVYRGFGLLNAFLAAHPLAQRSGHPDASMVAIGKRAGRLVTPHPLDSAYGPGSPLERFLEDRGRVLMLGAPPDSLTVLHYAEAIAAIPGKRRVSYRMPILDAAGRKVWAEATDFDSNGILDVYAAPGALDATEAIAREYLGLGRHAAGRVGEAQCALIDANDIVTFAVRWLETRHGA